MITDLNTSLKNPSASLLLWSAMFTGQRCPVLYISSGSYRLSGSLSIKVVTNMASRGTWSANSCIWNKHNSARGGCSSAGRAGRLAIGRSLAKIPAPGRAELHAEAPLSETPNPTWPTSEGPAMTDEPATHPASTSAPRQGRDRPQQHHPTTPWKGISGSDNHINVLFDFLTKFFFLVL